MEEKVCVSVICITYNHQKYIRQCIEGMICQKTDFTYEIIIHDDASTDGTVKIIKEYAEKYPNLIKPVLQKENQYSKGRKPIDISLKYAKGKYIALCDGDDYWCDDTKLQVQYSFMEAHPDCSLCFHDVECFDEASGELGGNWTFWNADVFRGAGAYTSEELMRLSVTPSSSMFYRKKDNDYKVLFSSKARFGDIIKTLHLAALGWGYCCERKMSVYRKNVPVSIMSTQYQNVESYNNSILATMETFSNFDQYYNGRFRAVMADKIQENKKKLLLFREESIHALQQECGDLYIYGTGVYGKLCYRELQDRNITIRGFVVTDSCYYESRIYDAEVFKYSAVKKDSGFILAAGKKVREELQIKLQEEQRNYCIGIEEQQ